MIPKYGSGDPRLREQQTGFWREKKSISENPDKIHKIKAIYIGVTQEINNISERWGRYRKIYGTRPFQDVNQARNFRKDLKETSKIFEIVISENAPKSSWIRLCSLEMLR